jgi:hypothetical protein
MYVAILKFISSKCHYQQEDTNTYAHSQYFIFPPTGKMKEEAGDEKAAHLRSPLANPIKYTSCEEGKFVVKSFCGG